MTDPKITDIKIEQMIDADMEFWREEKEIQNAIENGPADEE